MGTNRLKNKTKNKQKSTIRNQKKSYLTAQGISEPRSLPSVSGLCAPGNPESPLAVLLLRGQTHSLLLSTLNPLPDGVLVTTYTGHELSPSHAKWWHQDPESSAGQGTFSNVTAAEPRSGPCSVHLRGYLSLVKVGGCMPEICRLREGIQVGLVIMATTYAV